MIDALVPQYIRMLRNLTKLFDKAQAHAAAKKYEVDVLMSARLAPDMLPFSVQIQMCCDNAKGAVSRLSGKDMPKHDDNEKTIAELRERIAKVLGYLEGFKASDFKGYETRKITLPWIKDKHMLGADYLTQMALPNFYFHVTTAYNILRHNGVDVGKTDFIGSDIALKDG